MSGFYIVEIHVVQTVTIEEKEVATEATLVLSDQQGNAEPADIALMVAGLVQGIGDGLKKIIE
jgi:hypothetical protein